MDRQRGRRTDNTIMYFEQGKPLLSAVSRLRPAVHDN